MSYRSVFVENPAKVSIRNEQLLIETDAVHSLPLEDVCCLMLESRQSAITTAALAALAQANVAVFVCDEKHLPCGVLTSFNQHSRELGVLRLQLELPEPLKKRLWKAIVQAKIENQARCLAYNGYVKGSDGLIGLKKKVLSGDRSNQESAAAALYFPCLFGEEFKRRQEDNINSALNYGYAILRGYTARCLTAYGFQPVWGLHHCNTLNAFNLADDLMEPFRPVIDLMVSQMEEFQEDPLPKDWKKLLFACLQMEIRCEGKRQSVLYAIELAVKSLSRSLSAKENFLILPEMMELKLHTYE